MYPEYISNQIPIYAEIRGAKDYFINNKWIKHKNATLPKTFYKGNYDT